MGATSTVSFSLGTLQVSVPGVAAMKAFLWVPPSEQGAWFGLGKDHHLDIPRA